jgi:hypothetical protein
MMLSMMVMLISLTGYAQEPAKPERPPMQREQLQGTAKQSIIEMKKVFFKKNLVLSDKEAEQFWTVFDKYAEQESKIHKDFKASLEKEGLKREKGEMNEEEMDPERVIAYYDRKMKMKQDLLKAETQFYEQIKEILTPANVVAYYKLEKDFKKELATMREKRKAAPVSPVMRKEGDLKGTPDEMPKRAKSN